MKYPGMPAGMWALFAGSFRDKLTAALGYDRPAAAEITKKARGKYRELIGKLPDFEKGDRFRMNIVSCAMLAAFVLSMPRRPDVDELTAYYAAAMMTGPVKWFCRKSGKAKFSKKDNLAMLFLQAAYFSLVSGCKNTKKNQTGKIFFLTCRITVISLCL